MLHIEINFHVNILYNLCIYVKCIIFRITSFFFSRIESRRLQSFYSHSLITVKNQLMYRNYPVVNIF